MEEKQLAQLKEELKNGKEKEKGGSTAENTAKKQEGSIKQNRPEKKEEESEPVTKPESSKAPKKKEGKIAVIRVRGTIRVNKDKENTLKEIRLYRKNFCVVLDDNPVNRGAVTKVKDYVTWGEIDNNTLKILIEKRGKKSQNKEGKAVLKPFFRLSPPKGGFERKGIKFSFKAGGAVGNRGSKINELIKKML